MDEKLNRQPSWYVQMPSTSGKCMFLIHLLPILFEKGDCYKTVALTDMIEVVPEAKVTFFFLLGFFFSMEIILKGKHMPSFRSGKKNPSEI